MSLYHKILGVSEDDSIEKIKEQYRILCKKYHPDISDYEDIGKMALINEAYSALVKKPNNITQNVNQIIPNTKNALQKHKDPAYVFYKQGIKWYRKVTYSFIFSNTNEWKNTRYVFANSHNIHLCKKYFFLALYYFNIICTQYEYSIWNTDSVNSIFEINRKFKLLRDWEKKY